ncbi:hypothetical protein HMPREF1340_02277 [Enterococcus faecalis ERV73]|nr:hypothetical protein HMPREF1340_02277 [Enterococcus faecalis ERV73]
MIRPFFIRPLNAVCSTLLNRHSHFLTFYFLFLIFLLEIVHL